MITLNQPQLIDSILKDIKFQNNTKEKDTPALSSIILQKDTHGKPFNNDFHYWRVIGKLNISEKSLDQTYPMQYISVPGSVKTLNNHMAMLSGVYVNT